MPDEHGEGIVRGVEEKTHAQVPVFHPEPAEDEGGRLERNKKGQSVDDRKDHRAGDEGLIRGLFLFAQRPSISHAQEMKLPGFFCFTVFFLSAVTPQAAEVPGGFGQLNEAPKLIPGGMDEAGRKFSYLGQEAIDEKLILTASNGFFTDRVATAKGESDLPKVGDEELIVPNFAYLDWSGTERSLRWHVLVKKPGTVEFRAHLEVEAPGSTVAVSFAGEMKMVTTAKSGPGEVQPWDLSFEVAEPGEYIFALQGESSPSGKIGNLYRVDAFGPALEEAHLLRVRWRPAAVHGSYDTEKVSGAKLLVFTTRSVADISSYSPVTTPFGYYGTSFDADRRSNGAFNFSMWGKEDAASNLKVMPHLIGLGSPEGEFSGFGHEGSGVKPRGWEPMPDRPELVVQALRLESDAEYDTYFGYYFDHPINAWKFYAAGKKWHGGKPMEHLRLGSFCEVPGPPDRERTGDIYREVRRRGWAWDGEQWSALETYKPGGSGSDGELPVNKLWYTTADGEYAMGCGGIRLYHHDPSRVVPSSAAELPYFLSSSSVESLFRLPIGFGEVQVTEAHPTRAVIEFELTSGDALKDGMVYFGTRDALTFAPRELHGTERNSELSQAVQSSSWESGVVVESVAIGVNRVELPDLKPGTEYYGRILVNNNVSRIWSDPSFSFTTPEAGAAVMQEPLVSSASGGSRPVPATMPEQPFRLWTYTVQSETRTLEGRFVGMADGQVEIERKSDGKQGKMPLRFLSAEDQDYVKSAIRR